MSNGVKNVTSSKVWNQWGLEHTTDWKKRDKTPHKELERANPNPFIFISFKSNVTKKHQHFLFFHIHPNPVLSNHDLRFWPREAGHIPRRRRRRRFSNRRGPSHGRQHRRPDPTRMDLPDVAPGSPLLLPPLLPQPVLRLPHGASHHHSNHHSSRHTPYRPLHGRGSTRNQVHSSRVRVQVILPQPGPV